MSYGSDYDLEKTWEGQGHRCGNRPSLEILSGYENGNTLIDEIGLVNTQTDALEQRHLATL